MAVDIHNLIAAISPDTFCKPELRKEVRKIAKEKGYLEAAKKAKSNNKNLPHYIHTEARKNAIEAWGLTSPIEQHELIYDSVSEGLEPLYFWLLDFANRIGLTTEKIIDNFVSSPGSGHFSEMGQKATRMQEEAMKMLGAANQVLKSILNLIYDLKEMKLLLSTYDDVKSKDPNKKGAAILALKQRWMDMVDFAKRGTTSLKQMAAQMDYVTIIDAFMAAQSVNDVKKLDLNERVKRILLQRVSEFYKWVDESGSQLRTRYNIETKYLKSQVTTIKLYSRWIKPYLKAAKSLEQNANPSAALVTAFNTILLELTLMGKRSYSPDGDIENGVLPRSFKGAKLRKYTSLVFIEFKFRGIPQRASQRGDWAFGGRAEVKFTSYALNDEEIKKFKEELEKDDLGDMMGFIEGVTKESLEDIQKDIDEFLGEDKKKEEKKEKNQADTNPFSALFSFLKSDKKKDKDENKKSSDTIRPDNPYERIIRSQAILEARNSCFTVFDIYKRAHGMPAHPAPFDYI